jgi:hypothetical protein
VFIWQEKFRIRPSLQKQLFFLSFNEQEKLRNKPFLIFDLPRKVRKHSLLILDLAAKVKKKESFYLKLTKVKKYVIFQIFD